LSPPEPAPEPRLVKLACPITSSAVTSPAPVSPLDGLSGVLNVRIRLLPVSATYRLSLLSSASPWGEQVERLLGEGHPPAVVKLMPVLSTPKTLAALVDAKPLTASNGYSSTRPLPESET